MKKRAIIFLNFIVNYFSVNLRNITGFPFEANLNNCF